MAPTLDKPPGPAAEPDARYCSLFLVPHPPREGDVLDRLTLLACDRQGVAPPTLLPHPANPALGPAAAEEVEASLQRRRRAMFRIVENERQAIVDTLSSVAEGSLTTSQRTLQTELRTQAATATSHDKDEAEAVRALLNHNVSLAPGRESMQHSIATMRRQGHERIEKMRRQQLQNIAGDLEREVDRQEIIKSLEAKSAAMAEVKQRRAEEARRKAEEEELLIRDKQRIREEKSTAEAQRKLEEYEARKIREDRQTLMAQHRKNLKLQELKDQLATQEEKARTLLSKVREHDKAVQHERQMTYLESMEAQEERSDTLNLQREVKKEQHRVGSLRRFVAAKHYVEAMGDGSERAREYTEAHLTASSSLLQQQREDKKLYFKARKEKRAASQQKLNEVRQEEESKREIKIESITTEDKRKELYLQSLRQKQAEERRSKNAREAIRAENHEENLYRVERLNSHRQQVKESILADQDEQEKSMKAMRVLMARKMQTARLTVQKEQDKMQGDIQRLQASSCNRANTGAASSALLKLKDRVRSSSPSA